MPVYTKFIKKKVRMLQRFTVNQLGFVTQKTNSFQYKFFEPFMIICVQLAIRYMKNTIVLSCVFTATWMHIDQMYSQLQHSFKLYRFLQLQLYPIHINTLIYGSRIFTVPKLQILDSSNLLYVFFFYQYQSFFITKYL